MFSIIRRKDSLMLNLIVINDSYIISIYEFIIIGSDHAAIMIRGLEDLIIYFLFFKIK